MLPEHGCVPLPTEDRLHSDQENLLHPLLRRYPGHRKEQVQPGRGRPPGRSLPIATALVLCVPFGNPAVLVGPVALRPPLAEGLPLSRPALSGATSLCANIRVCECPVNSGPKPERQKADSTEYATRFRWYLWATSGHRRSPGAVVRPALLRPNAVARVWELWRIRPNLRRDQHVAPGVSSQGASPASAGRLPQSDELI